MTNSERRLIEILEELLNTAELNQDDIEAATCDTIDRAGKVLAEVSK